MRLSIYNELDYCTYVRTLFACTVYCIPVQAYLYEEVCTKHIHSCKSTPPMLISYLDFSTSCQPCFVAVLERDNRNFVDYGAYTTQSLNRFVVLPRPPQIMFPLPWLLYSDISRARSKKKSPRAYRTVPTRQPFQNRLRWSENFALDVSPSQPAKPSHSRTPTAISLRGNDGQLYVPH